LNNEAYGKKHTFVVPDDLRGTRPYQKRAFKWAIILTLIIYGEMVFCIWWGYWLAKH
jgi:hypothetical protein